MSLASGTAKIISLRSSATESASSPVRVDFARGISPLVLLSQVKGAAPYLFEGGKTEGAEDNAADLFIARPNELEYLGSLLDADRLSGLDPSWFPAQSEYFRLCLAAHWATVASFAPADVDHLIRGKLWGAELPAEILDEMARTVLRAYRWDETAMSRRWVESPVSGLRVSSHAGEWFAVAVPAYAACRKRLPERAAELREGIEFELSRQAKAYLEMKRAHAGRELLAAATLVAHNLADLDRAIEAASLEIADPLVEFAYRASGATGVRADRFGGALVDACRLNKAFMAAENHRHHALRAPRALRRSREFLPPVAPFFDDWGGKIARHPGLRASETAEILETLHAAWNKMRGPDGAGLTHAYPRAIAGIVEGFPGGLGAVSSLLPARLERDLRTGLLHGLTSVSQPRFEERWAQMALNFCK